MSLMRRISIQPAVSAAAISGGAASPGGTPQVMPLAAVSTHAAGSEYVTVAYGMHRPLWTTDGAAVPSTAPMRWGQLTAAGRP